MSVSRVANPGATRARNGEFASQLRSAVMQGDDARITRLLADLLRCKGLSRGARIALQQTALLSLVRSLRSATLNDELTGLYNYRGFAQVGTRMLDLAERDGQSAHLICFGIDRLERIDESVGQAAAEIIVREAGNLLRDLFPRYGVHEVLGRLATDEFAALTTTEQYASRQSIMLRIGRPERGGALPVLSLSVGVAHFDPDRPVGIDELLESARRAMNDPISQCALPGLLAQPA